MKALDSYGADQGYFVVNDYWTDSDKLIEAAKKEADSSFTVGKGHITIFEYDRLSKLDGTDH